ncbi:nitroreductase family deazaflavin-dependent oxidoreductase [Streptomyces nitrosporeus]|uniref:Nitroreductase family deazaflavin-dependent oxidoreductase n=2 Tax=Streptomyces nitrosporeus TaxID=28894 RepID=A0A5J6FIY6_9ACTN|nr:nitroreductase family deazaflavin-dependent oxidoreductase [Streptomyces nitrosporeus]
MPVLLFRMGIGPLFRGRLLLLVHTGRLTGEPRRTVLEVVGTGEMGGRRTWTLASGFGPRADWYRNLRRTPQAVVQAGRGYHAVSARFPAPEEGGELMARYADRHPRTARRLCAFMGFPVDGSAEDYRRAGASIPFVVLVEDLS